MRYETKVLFYDSENAMQRGIAKMQRRGWQVVSTEAMERDYGCAKTIFLGCLFLPLALLGKKPQRYKVEFRRATD
jgi:hypothetical protein